MEVVIYYTIPRRNSSSSYFVPRHVIPPFATS